MIICERILLYNTRCRRPRDIDTADRCITVQAVVCQYKKNLTTEYIMYYHLSFSAYSSDSDDLRNYHFSTRWAFAAFPQYVLIFIYINVYDIIKHNLAHKKRVRLRPSSDGSVII